MSEIDFPALEKALWKIKCKLEQATGLDNAQLDTLILRAFEYTVHVGVDQNLGFALLEDVAFMKDKGDTRDSFDILQERFDIHRLSI